MSKKRVYLELLKICCLSEFDIKQKHQSIKKAKFLCKFLEENNIQYDILIKHKEVKSCEESRKYYQRFQDYLEKKYVICKNLLVRERKGEKRNFLIITNSEKQLDLKALSEILSCRKLEFVPEEEMKKLIQATSGNVSLFNMMNDKENQVNLVMDEELKKAESLAFHPLYNGMSLFLSPKDCLKFLELIKRQVEFISMPTKEEKSFQRRLIY